MFILIILNINCKSNEEQKANSPKEGKEIIIDGLNVENFEIIGDGKTLNTNNIQKLIDSLDTVGG